MLYRRDLIADLGEFLQCWVGGAYLMFPIWEERGGSDLHLRESEWYWKSRWENAKNLNFIWLFVFHPVFFFVINFLSLCLNEHRQSIFSRTIFKCYIVFHLKVFQIESWNSGQKVNCHYSKSRFYLKKTWFQSLWKCVDNPEIGSKDLLTQTIGNWWHKSQAQIMTWVHIYAPSTL